MILSHKFFFPFFPLFHFPLLTLNCIRLNNYDISNPGVPSGASASKRNPMKPCFTSIIMRFHGGVVESNH